MNQNTRSFDSILDKHIRTLLILVFLAGLAGSVQANPGPMGGEVELFQQIRFQMLHQDRIWDPIKPFDPAAPVFEPGVLLVQFAEGTDLGMAQRLVAKGGFEVGSIGLFANLRVLSIKVPEGSELDALRFFRSSRAVSHAEQNPIVGIMG